MWYYDASGNSLNSGWGPFTSSPSSTWQLTSGSTTIPANAARVRLTLVYWSTSSADTNKVYFDDIALVGPNPSPYKLYLPAVIKNATGQ